MDLDLKLEAFLCLTQTFESVESTKRAGIPLHLKSKEKSLKEQYDLMLNATAPPKYRTKRHKFETKKNE